MGAQKNPIRTDLHGGATIAENVELPFMSISTTADYLPETSMSITILFRSQNGPGPNGEGGATELNRSSLSRSGKAHMSSLDLRLWLSRRSTKDDRVTRLVSGDVRGRRRPRPRLRAC